MKTKFKISNRILSLALAVVMVLSCLPLSSLMASAAEYEGTEVDTIYEVSFDPNGGQYAEESILAVRLDTDENGYLDQGWLDVMYTNFKRDGYSLSGYNTKSDGSGETVTGSLCFTQDTTVYVMWRCEHTGGTATCTEKAVCTLCGESYGDLGDHNFDENGLCSCGTQAVVKVKVVNKSDGSSYVNFYTDFDDAYGEWFCANGIETTMTLLTDVRHDGEYILEISEGREILDLNGFTLDLGDQYIVYYGGKLTILGKEGSKITTTADYCLDGSEVYLSGTVQMVGKTASFYVADDDNWVIINFTSAPQVPYTVLKEEPGIFARPVEGVTLDPGKFTSAKAGYMVIKNAEGELELAECDHSGNTNTEYTSNDGTHSLTCNLCGGTAASGDHTGGTATCTAKAKCTACGAEYGNLAEHTYGTEWKSDGTNHWHECTCGAKSDEAVHNGGTATCTEKTVCSVCDQPYGATLGHDWSNWISNGNGTHSHTCANDANHTETNDCSGGTATCKDKATCSACGTAYGELAAHTYESGKCTVCKAADPNYVPETDSPQTGDNSNMMLWLALLFISGGALITLTVVDRKRRTVASK